MSKSVFVVFLVIFFAVLAGAQNNTEAGGPEKAPAVAASPSDIRLPVRQVVLHKNGVGYFEHSARIHSN